MTDLTADEVAIVLRLLDPASVPCLTLSVIDWCAGLESAKVKLRTAYTGTVPHATEVHDASNRDVYCYPEAETLTRVLR